MPGPTSPAALGGLTGPGRRGAAGRDRPALPAGRRSTRPLVPLGAAGPRRRGFRPLRLVRPDRDDASLEAPLDRLLAETAGLYGEEVPRSGIRVERGVTYHGIALNIGPDLADFDLIDPCGMPGVASTSIAVEAGWADPLADTALVADAASRFASALGAVLDVQPMGALPPAADPSAGRDALERLLAGLAA